MRQIRLSSAWKTLLKSSLLTEITIKPHTVQNVVILKVVKGTQVGGRTVCMSSWLSWCGFFLLSSKALNQNAQRASKGWVGGRSRVEGGRLTSLHGMEGERAVRAGKH